MDDPYSKSIAGVFFQFNWSPYPFYEPEVFDITYGLTGEEAKLVLGGEVALWSEQADADPHPHRVGWSDMA